MSTKKYYTKAYDGLFKDTFEKIFKDEFEEMFNKKI